MNVPLPPPHPDEVELRRLVNAAISALGTLICATVAQGERLGYQLSDDAKGRLSQADYLLNTVHDDVTHYWEPLTPSPAETGL